MWLPIINSFDVPSRLGQRTPVGVGPQDYCVGSGGNIIAGVPGEKP